MIAEGQTSAGRVAPVGGHRYDIQGLRAVAVLLVALSHAGVAFLAGGYVGVDVFFVLSGFLITGLLISGAADTGFASLADFYARRARRILPAAALTLLATDVVAYELLNFVRAKQVLQDSIPASLFVANFHFANQGTNYFAQGQPPSPIQHFWSLSVEEQFYLAWPLVLLLVLLGFARRRRRVHGKHKRREITSGGRRRLEVAIAVITIASLIWSVIYTQDHPLTSYFSTFTRAWELGLGAGLAIAAARVSRMPVAWRAVAGWVGLAAIAAAAVLYSASTPFPGYAALLPTAGAALVIAAGLGREHHRFAVRRVLSISPARFVGDRSYAFYLWHWPFLIIAEQYKGHALSVITNLALLLGAFVVSIVSYALFENPIRRLRWSSAAYPLVLWPASVLAVIIVAGWGIGKIDVKATRLAEVGVPLHPSAGAPISVPTPVFPAGPAGAATSNQRAALAPVIAAVRVVRRAAPIPAPLIPPAANLLSDHYNLPSGCAPLDGQSTSKVCSLGDSTSARTLVVIGDSHVQMWLPTILKMASRTGWDVRPIVKSGCIPARWWHLTTVPADCRAWYGWAMGQVRSLRPTVTLLGGEWAGLKTYTAQVRAGITSTVAGLKPHSQHVVVIADQPYQTTQPVDCLLSQGATMSRCSLTPSPDQLAVGNTVAAAVRRAGAAYMDTTGWFCYENRCPMVVGHTAVYADIGHITGTYALQLSNAFQAAFQTLTGAKSR